jgi:hypothetical protein
MRKLVTLVFDKKSSDLAFLHDDDVVEKLGQVPKTVDRLSDVVFNDDVGIWDVVSTGTGKVLFSDIRRDGCLKWEREHILDLVLELEKGKEKGKDDVSGLI